MIRPYILAFILIVSPLSCLFGEELRNVGILGNSGESGDTLNVFSNSPFVGMGPVLDDQGTIWERAGDGRLGRYTTDGRMLESVEIPHSNGRNDILARSDNRLVMLLRDNVYTLPIHSPERGEVNKIASSVNSMSSTSLDGQVVIATADALQWLDVNSGERKPLVEISGNFDLINIGSDGTVYAKQIGGEMYAWKDGQQVEGFPKQIGGERPQLIGDYWYTHGYHGTIKRFNKDLEPDPGVVMGGASGSFIGFLPQSVDLTFGRGMVHLEGNLFAITGRSGLIQLLKWDGAQSKFHVVRRIGPAIDINGLALDHNGYIWTNAGVWNWSDNPDSPRTIGEPDSQSHTQPVLVGNKLLCVLQQRYSRNFVSSGAFLDDRGWSKYESDTVNGLERTESLRGTALVTTAKGKNFLITVRPDGSGYEVPVNDQGRPSGTPAVITLPGLKQCTSLAYAEGTLYAANEGFVVEFLRSEDGEWQENARWNQCESASPPSLGESINIQSDGTHLVISDTLRHRILVANPIDRQCLADFGQVDQAGVSTSHLNAPTHCAIQNNRVVVYDSANQRIVRFELGSESSTSKHAEVVALPRPSQVSFSENDYVDVSNSAGPFTSIAFQRKNDSLLVSLKTEVPVAPEIQLGLSASKSIILDNQSALVTDNGFHFQVPINALVDDDSDWNLFRWGAEISWDHSRLQRERFGHIDRRATFRPLSYDPTDWAEFSLEEYERRVIEKRNEIQIDFQQPMDGKATIVIEDSNGKRIRNLISGKSISAGLHHIVWDGLDENGRLVSPGKYRWHGISHPGLKPNYLMNFANGNEPTIQPWGPNHSTLHDVTSNGKLIFFAAPVTEGGWALLALDSDGNWVQGYEHQHGLGINHDAIAADDQYLYCAQDGFTWGGTRGIDLNSDQWEATWNLSLVRYDIASGKLIEFPDKQRHIIADQMQVGPGSENADLEGFNLGGLAVHNGRLYIGSRRQNAVLVLDAKSGDVLDKIAVKGPRKIVATDEVFVATDQGVVRLKDQKLIIPTGNLDIKGIAIAANQDILLSDRNSHQVHRFSLEGKLLQSIGTPGGSYAGTYDPTRIVNPEGIAFGPDGKLWVTEDRWSPKRVHAWDLDKNDVVYEKFGVPHYGGTGAAFDPQSHQQWIGMGCRWDIRFAGQEAYPTHVLAIDDAHFGKYHPLNYRIIREQGRTFLVGFGKITTISVFRPDGSIQDCAALSSTHHFSYGCNWEPPQSYIDAFYERWPQLKKNEKPGHKGEGKPYAQRGPAVLWLDANNDGTPQKEEFEFSDDSVRFDGSSWGHRTIGLTLKIPVLVEDQVKIVTLAPEGFTKTGVPKYPTLATAIDNATDIPLTPGYQRHSSASHDDHFGRFMLISDPEMNAYDESGKHLWSFPNQWCGVHGSHKAPLPEPGVMQGTLFFLGMAPLDDQADVFMLNGNHGRCFLLTSDGLYLDEMFRDVRVSYVNDAYRLGGEIFGGYFGKSEDNGEYYVQIGHGSYRLYGISGLNHTKRSNGTFEVTKQQVDAAEQKSLRRLAKATQPKEAVISSVNPSLKIDAELNDWHTDPIATWDQQGKFSTSLWGAWDEEYLYLAYRVKDASPFVNQGRNWSTLFATGDTIDLQFATDPAANPRRNSPVPGDKRLMIAPYEGKPTVVLFEHRKPNGSNNPIEFTSPWRGEKVDHVEKVDDAEVAVKNVRDGYVVEVKIPLRTLNWNIEPGTKYRGDFGVTFGDPEGHETQLRSYWANPSTMLVDDIPGEIMLHPMMWGEITFVRE